MSVAKPARPARPAKPEPAAAELPVLPFASKQAFSAWLDEHHASAKGLWLQLAKKASGTASVTYPEALEVALCYGWIDGQKQSQGEAAWLQKFTPRGPRSIWSVINREKAQQLIASGLMKPAGLAAIERAQRDGRWDAAYDSPKSATVPADFQAAIERSPRAKAFFATLDSRNRYALLFRLQTAKRPETRARRIEQFVQLLERNEKLH